MLIYTLLKESGNWAANDWLIGEMWDSGLKGRQFYRYYSNLLIRRMTRFLFLLGLIVGASCFSQGCAVFDPNNFN